MTDSSAEVMIEARGLSKLYGEHKALSELSFTVKRGEVVGFLGPNGAGKTTTMRILTGFLQPSEGQALIGGINVVDQPLLTRKRIGYLPESAPLYEDMMVLDFLNFVADMRDIPQNIRQQRMHDTAERCGLLDVLGKDIGQLSKGYRQRVGLAQALIHDPDLLILDEPTTGLDPNQIVEIRELIKELGKEKTIILSTHILPEVQATCSRALIIAEGKLVADDTPDGLAAREGGAQIRLIAAPKNGTPLQADKLQKILAEVEGVQKVKPHEGEGEGTLGFTLHSKGKQDPRAGLFRAAVDNDFVLLDLHREQLDLEATFRRLTRGEGEQQNA